jgi:hypothetical protein
MLDWMNTELFNFGIIVKKYTIIKNKGIYQIGIACKSANNLITELLKLTIPRLDRKWEHLI